MPKFELDENHIYRLDGRRLISVTQALQILDDRWKVDAFYLQRGIFVHRAIELWLTGELDEESVDPIIQPYLNGFLKFIDHTHYLPAMDFIEKPLFHSGYGYAGKPDLPGRLNGKTSVIDAKTGQPNPVDELQLAAYWELLKYNGFPCEKAFGLYLKDDGNYSLIPVEKPRSLLPVFLAALTCARWKKGL